MLTLRDISFAASPNPAAARRLHELRMRDPFIFTDRERGLYFLYGTNTDVADGAANIDPYFDFYVSEDLETFYGPYMAFKPPKGYWGVKHYWARRCTPIAESITCSPPSRAASGRIAARPCSSPTGPRARLCR